MKNKPNLRWILTLIFLFFVWRGDKWAIALSITLITISLEIIIAELFTIKWIAKK